LHAQPPRQRTPNRRGGSWARTRPHRATNHENRTSRRPRRRCPNPDETIGGSACDDLAVRRCHHSRRPPYQANASVSVDQIDTPEHRPRRASREPGPRRPHLSDSGVSPAYDGRSGPVGKVPSAARARPALLCPFHPPWVSVSSCGLCAMDDTELGRSSGAPGTRRDRARTVVPSRARLAQAGIRRTGSRRTSRIRGGRARGSRRRRGKPSRRGR
jgi:hypothetical protein